MTGLNKYSGILLAAGNSSRMNSWKPGALIENEPVLFFSLKTMSAVCSDIVVVGGFNIDELRELVERFQISYLPHTPNCHPHESDEEKTNVPLSLIRRGGRGEVTSITCVENKNYNSGMFSSVKAGLSHTQQDNVFIALADMPFVSIETYIRMTDRADIAYRYADVIYPVIVSHSPEKRFKKGHPVLIRSKVKDRILNESGDVVLRDILKEFNGKQCLVNDAGISIDIDTEEDFEKAKQYYSYFKNTQENK